MVCKVLVFSIALTLASVQLGSAARMNVKTHALKTNGTDSTTKGSICTISEKAEHVQYGIKFRFKTKKCSRISCNPFKFLDETIGEMMHAVPKYKGVDGTCACYVKQGPGQSSPDDHHLMSFLQFKKKGKAGQYIYQCNPEMCWERYGQMVTLGMRAEHGSIDWPRTEDVESRNHWNAECIEGDSSGGSVVANSVLPTAHEVIQKLKDEGKTEAVEEILEIVNDEQKDEVTEEFVEQREEARKENKNLEIFVTEVDDSDQSGHLHRMEIVKSQDWQTKLRDIVVLSPIHGNCAKSAVSFTRLSPDDVTCGLIKSPEDGKLAAMLLGRKLDTHEGPSDIFNDMSPPEDEVDQFYANDFKVKALQMYPPALFGRIMSQGAQMHISWNPLLPPRNKDRGAEKKKSASVMTRVICGCYDKA